MKGYSKNIQWPTVFHGTFNYVFDNFKNIPLPKSIVYMTATEKNKYPPITSIFKNQRCTP